MLGDAVTTYFAPERFGCPGFSQAVADLQKAEGVGRWHSGDANVGIVEGYNPTLPPVTGGAPLSERLQFEQWTSALGEASEVYEYVVPVISGGSSVVKFADDDFVAEPHEDPAACCAACSANADCIAWQLVGHDLDDYDYDYDISSATRTEGPREHGEPRAQWGALAGGRRATTRTASAFRRALEDPNLNYIDAADWATSQVARQCVRQSDDRSSADVAAPPPPPPDEPPSHRR